MKALYDRVLRLVEGSHISSSTMRLDQMQSRGSGIISHGDNDVGCAWSILLTPMEAADSIRIFRIDL
jgi:hypothetical protein